MKKFSKEYIDHFIQTWATVYVTLSIIAWTMGLGIIALLGLGYMQVDMVTYTLDFWGVLLAAYSIFLTFALIGAKFRSRPNTNFFLNMCTKCFLVWRAPAVHIARAFLKQGT